MVDVKILATEWCNYIDDVWSELIEPSTIADTEANIQTLYGLLQMYRLFYIPME